MNTNEILNTLSKRIVNLEKENHKLKELNTNLVEELNISIDEYNKLDYKYELLSGLFDAKTKIINALVNLSKFNEDTKYGINQITILIDNFEDDMKDLYNYIKDEKE